MDRAEILSCPVGELSDMIACLAIENGAKPKYYADLDELVNIR